jgi:hypothetical protein
MFCTDRVVHFSLSFIDLAIELAPIYKLLKPHLDFLMYHVCFPTICLNADDLDVFAEIFDGRAEDHASDASEAIDANFNHDLFCFVF